MIFVGREADDPIMFLHNNEIRQLMSSDNCQTVVPQLSDHRPSIVRRPSLNCQTTVPQLSDDISNRIKTVVDAPTTRLRATNIDTNKDAQTKI